MRINIKSLMSATLLLCSATAVWGGEEKLAKDLRRDNAPGNLDVIVRYKTTPSEKHRQKIANRGGALKNQFDLIKSGHYSVPANMLRELANDPDVEYVSPNRPVGSHSVVMLDQAMATMGADLAYQFSVNGTGVGIAVIDSGIGNNTDVSGKVVYRKQFAAGGAGDPFGHGTHIAGLIAGSGTNSTGSTFYRTVKGVAPGVRLIDIRVLDEDGNGRDSDVITGIQHAIALKSQYNIRVINLSLGRPIYESYKTDPLCLAVEQAWKAGIVVVVAAGNYGRTNPTTTYGYGTITSPGFTIRSSAVGPFEL